MYCNNADDFVKEVKEILSLKRDLECYEVFDLKKLYNIIYDDGYDCGYDASEEEHREVDY